MLAMFSPVEIAAVLIVSALFFVVIFGGAGFLIYFVMRKAARDGARDAAREPPKTNDASL